MQAAVDKCRYRKELPNNSAAEYDHDVAVNGLVDG